MQEIERIDFAEAEAALLKRKVCRQAVYPLHNLSRTSSHHDSSGQGSTIDVQTKLRSFPSASLPLCSASSPKTSST